jgi:hypothetical protein
LSCSFCCRRIDSINRLYTNAFASVPSWVCLLFLVYLNYCTVIISVLKSVNFASGLALSLSLILSISLSILPFACILTKGGSYLSISYFL